jgi:hypothetical protein
MAMLDGGLEALVLEEFGAFGLDIVVVQSGDCQ